MNSALCSAADAAARRRRALSRLPGNLADPVFGVGARPVDDAADTAGAGSPDDVGDVGGATDAGDAVINGAAVRARKRLLGDLR